MSATALVIDDEFGERVRALVDVAHRAGEIAALVWVRDCFNLDTEDVDALNAAIEKALPE